MRKLHAALFLVALSVSLAAQGVPGPSVPGGVPGASLPGQPGAKPRDAAQPVPTGTGRIRGRVLEAGTNAPLRRVQMSLQLSDSQQFRRTINTDAQGRYEFTELPAGRFSLGASKPGYVGLQYGQRRPFETGTPIALAVAETLGAIDFALPRGGVITGRITDEFGELMPQVQVQVQRFQYSADGQRRLSTAGTGTTDDRGEFRVYGLMPGEYVINGSMRTTTSNLIASLAGTAGAEPSDGYPPTFYPGTTNANQAQPITLGIGEEVSVQFGLVAARLVRISGTVRDSEGRPAAGEVILLPRNAALTTLNLNTIGPDGSFTIRGVAAGEYTLEVRRLTSISTAASKTAPEGASVPVVVTTSDITGLNITTSRGSLITGRVVWEGTAPKTNSGPAPAPIRVVASPTETASVLSLALGTDPNATGQVDDNGTFQLGGVSGRVFLSVATPTGWTLKSVTLDGRDFTDVPLDASSNVDGVRITMTDKLTNVSGRVSDAKGSGVLQYVVVVQPADEMEQVSAMRYVRTTRPDTNGRFEFRALRPGRYLVTAIEAMEQGRQASPEFRRQLQRGARAFTLREGESLSLDLRLTEGL